MKMSFSGSFVDGTVSPPASKSYTHRAFILAALSEGTSVISDPLFSADTISTLNAISAFGAKVERNDSFVRITGGELKAPSEPIDAENSGTTMRLMTGISSAFDKKVTITGDDSLLKRPMSPLLDALESIGVECSSNKGFPPISVKGPIDRNEVSINGSMSSQFVSSLMMTAPLLKDGLKIHVKGKLVSKPYVDITTYMMSVFGANASMNDKTIESHGRYRSADFAVPADFSSAAFPLVAGALAGKVTVKGMDMNAPQGDKMIVDILKKAGAKISIENDSITCEKDSLSGTEIDIGNVPDLFPILAVLFCAAEGKTILKGAPQLRFKESDRIESVTEMISAIGGDIKGTDDGCVINGTRKLKGGEIDCRGDHRIMMAASIASLICDEPVTMENAECCSVSYPQFPEHMRILGMKVI